jgi:integral membrane protein (TIGR00529 family)
MLDMLKLLAILALIVFLLNRRWNLGLVLLLASALLGLLFARPAQDLTADVFLAVADRLTLRLACIVVLILTLGEILRRTARLEGMVHSLEQLIPDSRLVFAVVPAVIGMLPMVGGAMFSAPMVNRLGDQVNASPDRKTFVNYWFRHFWEYVFPLYPSFLIGVELLGFSSRPQVMTRLLWPLAAASVAGGVLFGLLGTSRTKGLSAGYEGGGALRELAMSVWPIGLVLILAVGAELDLILSLLATLLALALVNRVGPAQFWDIMRHHIRWNTVAVIFGAMIFRRVLEETGAVTAASEALTQMNVPVTVAVFAVPFLAGLLSGLGTAAFAIGFPIVLPLMTHSHLDMGLAAWAWAGGFLGIMTSPIHLCLALTRDYFRADWGLVYRRILPASLLVVLTGIVLVLVR